jgi:WD40 repeat protein
MREPGRTVVRGVAGCAAILAAICGSTEVSCGDSPPAAPPPEPRVLFDAGGQVTDVAVSADGELVAALTTWGTVRIASATTGAKVRDLPLRASSKRGLSFSAGPPLSVVTWADAGTKGPVANRWDAVTGAKRPSLEPAYEREANAGTGDLVGLMGAPSVPAATNVVYAIWSRGVQSCIAVHDAQTGVIVGRQALSDRQLDLSQGLPTLYTGIVASTDGRIVVAIARGILGEPSMRVFSATAGGHQLTSRGTFKGAAMSCVDGHIVGLAVTDDGAGLVAMCSDRTASSSGEAATLACISTSTGQRLWERPVANDGWIFRSTAGEVVAMSHGGGLELTEIRTGSVASRLPLPANVLDGTVALGPGAARVFAATSEGKVVVWDVVGKDGAAPPQAPAPAAAPEVVFRKQGVVTALAVAPDESLVVTGSPGGDVRVLDVASRSEARALRGHRESIESVAFLGNDTAWLMTWSSKRLRVWNPLTGFLRKELVAPDKDASEFFSVHAAPSATAHVVAVCGNSLDDVILWDGDGTSRTLTKMRRLWLGNMSLSRDGTRLGAMLRAPGATLGREAGARGFGVFDARTGDTLWSRDRFRRDMLEAEERELDRMTWIATRFTPNGERFLRLANDRDGGHVRSNATENGVAQWSVDLPGVNVRDVVFRSDGRALLVTNSVPQILDTRAGTAVPAAELPSNVSCAAFAPKSGALYLGLTDGSVVRTSLSR